MRKAKLTALALILCFVLASAAPVFSADGYSDVKESRWSRAAIMYVTEKGYMNGVSDGKFDPAGSMTRAMFVTVLWRRENSPAAEYRPDFSDVKSGKYYSKAVIWAKDKGIVSGVTGTTFDPDGKITREQLATMLYRYCSVKNLYVDDKGDVSSFSDKSKIHSYASDALSWAVGVGLIGGVTKDSLDPRGLATREQVATILKRFDEADIITLADYYRPYVEQMADYAELMLAEKAESVRNDPDHNGDFLVWDWGVLVVGLIEAGRYEAVADFVELWLDYGGREDVLPCDPGLTCYAVLALYEKTGEQKYADLAHEFMASFDRWPCDEYGQVRYDDSPTTRDIYVDGTGMVTIFLGRYAADFSDEDVRQMAIRQVNNYLDQGIDPARHLAYHGYVSGGSFCGEMGWGRGTGWLMLAIGSVMRYCGDDAVNARCDKFIEQTFKYLKPEYKFGWTLSDRDADSDTSATGMIMWAVMQAKKVGLGSAVSDETVKAVAKAGLTDVSDGVIYGCSGGSAGFGGYSEEHNGNFPWGQGAMLAFYGLFLDYLENN